MMYSYVLKIDDGAAPNPYYGYCTLAICKPYIRRKANIGDWIIGTGNKKVGNNKLVYAMKVREYMNFNQYFDDDRFKNKKPDLNSQDKYAHLGDNIYKPTRDGFEQLPSVHSNGKEENIDNKKHDLGKNLKENNRLLISEEFYYFGDNAIELPLNLKQIIKRGQWHKSTSIGKSKIEEFEKFIKKFTKGVNGNPNDKLSPKDILDIKCIKTDECCID